MNLKVSEGEGHISIYLSGRIDHGAVRDLEGKLADCLKAHPQKRFLLNLRDVQHLGSSALAVLVGFQRSVMGAGQEMCLVDVAPAVRRIIELLELGGRFTEYPDEATALQQ